MPRKTRPLSGGVAEGEPASMRPRPDAAENELHAPGPALIERLQ